VSLGRIFVMQRMCFGSGTRSHLVRHRLLWHTARRCHPHTQKLRLKKIFLDFGLSDEFGLNCCHICRTGLVNKEIEKRTVPSLNCQAISRVEFITGKHLGLSAVLALLVAAMTAIYRSNVHFWKIPYPLGSILLAALYLFVINHSSRYWVGCIYQFSVSDAA